MVIANFSGTRRPFKGPQDSDQVLFDGPVFCCNVWKFQGGGFEVSGKMFRRVPHQKNLTTWSGGRSSSLREEVFVQYLYGSFREEVVKFQGRCFEELLTRKLDDVVRGEVVKFEGGGMPELSTCKYA